MPYQPDQLHIAEDANRLFQECAENIVEYANECVKAHGLFSMVLAGGSTPQRLYLQLSSTPLAEQMPWQSCQFYFGDERMVPHDHADSNYAMAKQALFNRVPVPAENIHPIPTNCREAQDCADQYEQQLIGIPSLDLVLLGMGEDGHTASLFPDTDILTEKQKNAAAVYVDKLAAWRISLTYPCINRSARVMILAQGTGKTEIVHEVLLGNKPEIYPVTGVRPTGQLIWYLDRDAYPDTRDI
jgi:6-phosphogluconolactonase